LFPEVYVSTEDEEIAAIAKDFGAVVIERPPNLAIDTTPMSSVIDHALSWYERGYGTPQRIFLLQPTSPLRTAGDIRRAAELFAGDCDSVMAVFEATEPPQWALRSGKADFLEPVFAHSDYAARRQDLETCYFDGPLYAIETRAFRVHRRLLTEHTRFFVIPASRAVDIDTELDFRFAEFLLTILQERFEG
jgi:N-acylneuraminate cytidylyltransferase/CMP-N,N'-diacetyllegionaminic acid synthase